MEQNRLLSQNEFELTFRVPNDCAPTLHQNRIRIVATGAITVNVTDFIICYVGYAISKEQIRKHWHNYYVKLQNRIISHQTLTSYSENAALEVPRFASLKTAAADNQVIN